MPSYSRAVFTALASVVFMAATATAQPCLDSLMRATQPGTWVRAELIGSTRIEGRLISITAAAERPAISLRLQETTDWRPLASTKHERGVPRDTIVYPGNVSAFSYRTDTGIRDVTWLGAGTVAGAMLGYALWRDDPGSSDLEYALIGGAIGLGVSFFAILASNPTTVIRCD